MNSKLNLLTVLTSLFFVSFSAQAEGISESAMLLQEAMMQSNADYNKHKKKANHEEFDRADTWGERDTMSITIDQKALQASDYQDFQQIKGEFEEDLELSANDEQKEQDLGY